MADVKAALDKLGTDGLPVLIATEQGSYGKSTLYANREADGDIYFIYMGFDEYGKPNSFTFYGCTPVSGAPAAAATATATMVPEPTPD